MCLCCLVTESTPLPCQGRMGHPLQWEEMWNVGEAGLYQGTFINLPNLRFHMENT